MHLFGLYTKKKFKGGADGAQGLQVPGGGAAGAGQQGAGPRRGRRVGARTQGNLNIFGKFVLSAVQELSRDPLDSQGVQKNPRYIDKPHVVQILKIIFVYFKITIKGFEYVVRYKVFLFVVFILYDSRLGG